MMMEANIIMFKLRKNRRQGVNNIIGMNYKIFIRAVCVMITYAFMSCTRLAFATGLEISLSGQDWYITTDSAALGPGEEISSVQTCTGSLDSNGYCWRYAEVGQTCTTACANYKGCRPTNWNDDSSCTRLGQFTTCSTCGSTNSAGVPGTLDYGVVYCYYRITANQDCGTNAGYRRICVCNQGGNYSWTVTGSSDGAEDVYAKVSTTDWAGSSDATNGVNEFVLTRKHASDADVYIPTDAVGNGALIKDDLPKQNTYTFWLNFKAPATGSASGSHTLTVTLTVTGWSQPCSGWLSGGLCWYEATGGTTCTSLCASHAGCDNTTTWNDDAGCTMCKHFHAGAACGADASAAAPYWRSGQGCKYRSSTAASCDTSASAVTRQCACNQ